MSSVLGQPPSERLRFRRSKRSSPCLNELSIDVPGKADYAGNHCCSQLMRQADKRNNQKRAPDCCNRR